MLTWQSFLGSVISALLGRLSREAVTRLGPQKERTVEQLVRLYFALVELRRVTHRIVEAGGWANKIGTACDFENALNDNEDAIRGLSSAVVETFAYLGDALELIAPELATAFDCVINWKYNLLYEASRCVKLVRPDGTRRIVRLRFTDPRDRLLELEFSEHVDWVMTHTRERRAELWALDSYVWPQSLLVERKVEDAFADSEIDLDDISAVVAFTEKLSTHSDRLEKAIAALREWLKHHASLDDVLKVLPIESRSVW